MHLVHLLIIFICLMLLVSLCPKVWTFYLKRWYKTDIVVDIWLKTKAILGKVGGLFSNYKIFFSMHFFIRTFNIEIKPIKMLSYTTYNWPHPNFSSNHPQPKLPNHPPSSGNSNFIDAALQSLYQHCCFIFALTLLVGLSKNIWLFYCPKILIVGQKSNAFLISFCQSFHLVFTSHLWKLWWIDPIFAIHTNQFNQILFPFFGTYCHSHCMSIQNKNRLTIC